MKRPRVRLAVSLGLAGLVGLLILGFLVTRIGGVAIRSSVVQVANLPLRVADPLVPGLPTRVGWDVPDAAAGPVQVLLRDQRQEHEMGRADFSEGGVLGAVPCEVAGTTVSVVLRETATGTVLGFREVSLLPPGPECVLAQ